MKTTTWVAFCLLFTAAFRIHAEPPPGASLSGHGVRETFRDCADACPRMVVIPPGSFRMGSPDDELGRFDGEGPVHEVHISYAFAVSKYPITRGEWKQFVNETGHKDASDCLKGGQQDNRPVVCVDWQDAQDYAGWLSRKSGHRYRLLSEAEYEYVNRAGSQTVYFWGDSYDRRYANDGLGTTAVGSFKPNPFGLYDTTGNVWSWTQDCWHDNYDGAPTDGSAWTYSCSYGRVVRGRPWAGFPRWLRSASRGWSDGFDGDGGFRLARD
jgi:formylglycine-generating enzyme required for sulfatase activity